MPKHSDILENKTLKKTFDLLLYSYPKSYLFVLQFVNIFFSILLHTFSVVLYTFLVEARMIFEPINLPLRIWVPTRFVPVVAVRMHMPCDE